MSGEIIQMSNKQNLIFEAEDLEQASPATVSRCGMIFMEPHQLGWRPLKTSYMAQLPSCLTEEHHELVNDLFDWLIDPCLGEDGIVCDMFHVILRYGIIETPQDLPHVLSPPASPRSIMNWSMTSSTGSLTPASVRIFL